MEFKMSTDLQTALPRSIEFNAEELKAEIAGRLEHYNHMILTEETLKEGKADLANLRKLKDAIDTRRKEVKKQWMAPFTKFENEVKDVMSLIDVPIGYINTQVKAFEEQRKEDKRDDVYLLYEDMVPAELKDIIPFEHICDPKWLNATTSMKKVGEDLAAIIRRTSADMMVIDTVEPEYAAAVREVYVRTLNIEKAMLHRNALKDAAAAFAQREEQKARQAEKIAQQEPKQPEANNQPAEIEAPQEEKLYRLRLEFCLTARQAAELKEFLTRSGIDYTKI